MRALLVGNYGVGNLGDEALREYFLERFGDIEWTVVSAAPATKGEVPRLPAGVRSLFATPWWRTLSACAATEVVVFGGGTLFTDAESVRACRIWRAYARVARFFRKPVCFAFQGIGPFRSAQAKNLAADALRGAAFLSVRDEASFERASELVKGVDIVRSFDPIVSVLSRNANTASPKRFVVIPRANTTEAFAKRAAQLAASYQVPVAILSLQPHAPQEQRWCESLREVLPSASVVPVNSVRDLADGVSGAAFLFTARFHGAIAALALGVPFEVFAQAGGDKLSSLHASADRAMLLSLVDAGERRLREAFAKLGGREVPVSS